MAADTLPSGLRTTIIPVHGEVDATLQHFVARAIDLALKAEPRPQALIFDIDTWGGRLDAAFEISDTISSVRDIPTVAWVGTKAISAGALIALSADRLHMGPGATIGDAAPIIQTQEGPQFVGEKIESPLRARFRALANENRLPVPLVEKMVSREGSVVLATLPDGRRAFWPGSTWKELPDSVRNSFLSFRTVIAEGQLLTIDDREAVEFGFSAASFPTRDSLIGHLRWTSATVIQFNWGERFARWIAPFVPFLFVFGLAALWLEYKNPGFGFFGILGMALLALAMGSQWAIGLADHTEILLAIIGIALIAIEVFVAPGTLFLAGAGLLFLLTSLVLSLQDFTFPAPGRPDQVDQFVRNFAQVAASTVAAGVMSLLAVRFILPRIPWGQDGPYLETTLSGTSAPYGGESAIQLGDLVGRTGTVVIPLRPTGRVQIDGMEHEAISRSGMLKPGTEVRVAEVGFQGLIVDRREESA